MNNNIIKMRVRYLCRHPFIYALLCLLAACTNELEISGDHGMSSETSKIPIDLTAKLAAGENAPVSKVRVIIFSTRSSIPEGPKVLVTNEEINVNANAKIETYVGYNDIYVIGNGPTDLAFIKTPQELKAILIQTNNNATLNDVVLFQQLLNVRIENKDKIFIDENSPTVSVSKLDIKLQHVMAKLSVDFDLSTEIKANGTPTNDFFNFKSMEIINIPKHSGLIPQIYKATQGYMDKRSFDLTKNGITQNNKFKWSSGDIFLPEHLIDNDTHRTILLIKGEVNKTSYTYTVSIGDSINPTDSKSNKWNVTRNRHYKLNIKSISGYGKESLETSASVVDWSEQNVPIEISGPNFIILTAKEVDVKSLRFPTYIRFISNDSVKFEYPRGFVPNELSISVQYDDVANKSGRIAISKGNWFTSRQDPVNITVKSGTASVNLKLKFVKTEYEVFWRGDTWAAAMGYPDEANHKTVGYYNRALYKKQKTPRGCNNYYRGKADDPITGKGCWRLATIRENGAFAETNSWCIEEYGHEPDLAHTSTISYKPPYYYLGHARKTMPYPYVCVLDVRPPEVADFIVSDKDQLGIPLAEAEQICNDLGDGWKLPNGEQMEYVFNNAGANGLPNNFFANSYWGKNIDGTFIVATMEAPGGIPVTDDMKNQKHAVRCLKSRY